jgi:CubicO group peptidase (beta-lactamase class C family)
MDTFAPIDAYVERQRRQLRIPGVSLAVVDGDQVAHLRGFGQARPGGPAPGPATPFCIGSLTKSFTALALMQLAEAGRLDLDAPAVRYLPWFRLADPQASARITVRHLLVQTSGLPNGAGEIILADFDQRPEAAQRQARALAALAPRRPPGAAWEYSNSNYQLLGLILEAASGVPYADYIQARLFTPLGMRHSYVSAAAAPPGELAVGHQLWFGFPVAVPAMPMPAGALAGGGLLSSAEDLARWLIVHLNGGRLADQPIVSAAALDELHRGAADMRAFGRVIGQYGMGWCVGQLGADRVVWHGGTLPHFGAFMALLPERRQGLVLLFNACHHWFNPVQTAVGLGAAGLLAGEPPAPLPGVGLIPGLLRAQALLPALQAAGAAATLSQWRQWRRAPSPGPRAGWPAARRLVLPLLVSLLPIVGLRSVLSRRRGYEQLYLPDVALITRVCGTFALAWGMLAAGLVVHALRRPAPPSACARPSAARPGR